MKRRIARCWIVFAEISGSRVPDWIESWLGDEVLALRNREVALTRALRKKRPAVAPPPMLAARIEAALRTDGDPVNARLAGSRFPARTLAGAAGLALACAALLFSIANREPAASAAEEVVSSIVRQEAQPVDTTETESGAVPIARWVGRIDDPLEQERAHLQADLAAAAQWVFRSFVPTEYRAEVEANREPQPEPASAG